MAELHDRPYGRILLYRPPPFVGTCESNGYTFRATISEMNSLRNVKRKQENPSTFELAYQPCIPTWYSLNAFYTYAYPPWLQKGEDEVAWRTSWITQRRKETVQDVFHTGLGLLVDVWKPDHGTIRRRHIENPTVATVRLRELMKNSRTSTILQLYVGRHMKFDTTWIRAEW
jgi:hypothetical protein